MRARRAASIAVAIAALGGYGAAIASGRPPPDPERDAEATSVAFDIEAHRGGAGLVTESTLEAFANALELGVTTLELDVRLSADERPVVTHDRRVSPMKCRDTAPVIAGDPDFPYAGDLIRSLTYAQVATLDCGWRQAPGFPEQRVATNARMPLLDEVFGLVECYAADTVRVSIDPKFPAAAAGESASRGLLVRVVAAEIRKAGMRGRVAIGSTDWDVLMRIRKLDPRLSIVALAHPRFLQVGKPGASPWLGGIDIDDYDGGVVAAAASFGADAITPVHGTPVDAARRDAGYHAFTTVGMVRRAHRAGMEVIPWTVDDGLTMRELIKIGVDGIVTDYPDRLRTVIAQRGLPLPAPTPPPGDRRCLA